MTINGKPLNGWAIRIVFGVCLMAFVSHQTWASLQLISLGKIAARLDERITMLTAELQQINTASVRIRALERRTAALEGRG